MLNINLGLLLVTNEHIQGQPQIYKLMVIF